MEVARWLCVQVTDTGAERSKQSGVAEKLIRQNADNVLDMGKALGERGPPRAQSVRVPWLLLCVCVYVAGWVSCTCTACAGLIPLRA